jgi:hypothetical protein
MAHYRLDDGISSPPHEPNAATKGGAGAALDG